MNDQGLPMEIVIQYQEPKPGERGSVMRIRYVSISRFNNYRQLESYLLRKCGGDYRSYPGGADYPVITYNKYNDPYDDMDFVMRELRTEAWDDFAASVSHICVERVDS